MGETLTEPRIWLKSAKVDFFVYNSVFWIFPLYLLFEQIQRQWAVQVFFPILVIIAVVSALHAVLPSVLAVTYPQYSQQRTNLRRLYFWLPLGIIVACFVLSFGRSLTILGAIYVLWNSWHNARTNFGILMLYSNIRGQSDQFTRRVNWYYCVAVNLICLPLIWYEKGVQLGVFLHIKAFAFLNNLGVLAVTLNLMFLAIYLVFMVFRSRMVALGQLIFAISMGLIAVLGYVLDVPFLFVFFLPHWILELGVLHRVYSKETGLAPRRIVQLSAVIGSLALVIFYFVHRLATIQYGLSETGEFDSMRLSVGKFDVSAAMTFWVYFSIVLLHFYYSSILYRRTTGLSLAKVFR